MFAILINQLVCAFRQVSASPKTERLKNHRITTMPTKRDIPVASAAPIMPSIGNGPTPKISSQSSRIFNDDNRTCI